VTAAPDDPADPAGPADPADPADTELTLALYLAIGRIVRNLRQEAPNSEVGPGGLAVLVTLDQQGPSRVGALADAVAVTAPSMTRIVNALERDGLVLREPDPADGRAQVVAMTATGRSLLGSGREIRLATLSRRLGQLAPEERKRLEAAVAALAKLGGAAAGAP
jgi:DNA-binding MarR family transcriptional regulator